MTSASEYLERAQNWIAMANRLPPDKRASAIKVAEVWLQIAQDAIAIEVAPFKFRN